MLLEAQLYQLEDLARFAERHKPDFACCSLMWDETGERLSLNVATRLGFAFFGGFVLRQ